MMGCVALLVGVSLSLSQGARAIGFGVLVLVCFGLLLWHLVRTGQKGFAVVLFLAFALRLVVALVIAQGDMIPHKYLTDHRTYHELSTRLSSVWIAGNDTDAITRNLGTYRTYVYVSSAIYYVIGPNVFVMQLLNIVVMCVALWGIWQILNRAFGNDRIATATVLIVALWPGGIIQDAMNNREAFALVSLTTSFWFFTEFCRTRRFKDILFSGLTIIVTGLFRDYLVVVFLGSVAAWLALDRPSMKRAAVLGGVLVTTFVAAHLLGQINPHIPDVMELLTPAGLQKYTASRVVGVGAATALFPDRVYHTWFDVLLFLPKGFIMVLLQPFPGLYPISNLARLVAAAENVVLLVLIILGLRSMKQYWSNPALRFLLLATLVALTVHGLVDSDLGTATRHKRVFLPYIVCFAVASLASLARSDRSLRMLRPFFEGEEEQPAEVVRT